MKKLNHKNCKRNYEVRLTFETQKSYLSKRKCLGSIKEKIDKIKDKLK